MRFAALLLRWNAIHNLTAIERAADVGPLHLLDSLAIIPALQDRAPPGELRILDVGSGGGLPGIPLAIAWPHAHVVLLDKVRKKTAFLQHAKTQLQLANVEVAHARVEAWQAPPFPLIVSRALTTLSDFVALTDHLLAEGGLWAAMKGALPVEEIAALPTTVRAIAAVKLRVPLLAAERHLILLRRRQDAPADAGA
ncbi:MAG TPA: 16S rRNA (guanine(527)-N(7))-methyltransferase RsmG [Burkholderiaceae bacterium]|nr:16S rRNA (guanine(527)-N(7))-methyltransferase RsmG [Burkholderiaceae bacterium]